MSYPDLSCSGHINSCSPLLAGPAAIVRLLTGFLKRVITIPCEMKSQMISLSGVHCPGKVVSCEGVFLRTAKVPSFTLALRWSS